MSTYQQPKVTQGPPTITDAGIWGEVRYDADDSAPTYIGMHVTQGESTASTDWKLLKFTYSGSNVTRIQLTYNSWDNRASAF